jgi:nondiscriminating aspartyl-tRNA synthetase
VIEVERVLTSELGRHVGERVRIAGWLQHQRRLRSVTFVVVRDGSGTGQVVVEDEARRAQVASLAGESVIAVDGDVVATAEAPGGVEVRASSVHVISESAAAPAVELRRPALKERLPTVLDHAPVALRHPRERAKFAVSAAAVAGYRSALDRLGFTEIQTPRIVASATEGGANLFEVDYFGRPAYLAQSPQLYKQVLVGVFERVYETGPVFRAEPHETGRHLSEYVSLDAEAGFVEDHRTVMGFARDAVAGLVEGVRSRADGAAALLGLELPGVPAELPSIHFADALELVGGPPDEADLTPDQERRLGEWARREHASEFLFVVGYPLAKRPFYTHPDPARPGYSNSFDLLFRGLEIMTGGQRLHRYADYLEALADRGLDPDPFAGYLEAFRHGMPPHGGFAIGLERWVARLVGAANVRETTLFPRDRQRLVP